MEPDPAKGEAFLKHYGKKGMKWGVRNDDRATGREEGAAEPLTAKKQQKVDAYSARASAARALSQEMDELGIDSPRMRELYGKGVDRSDRMFAIVYGQSKDKAVQRQIDFENKKAEDLEKAVEQIEAGKLTSGQKQAIIGGLALAAVVGYTSYGIYQDSQAAKAGPGESTNMRVFQRKYGESAEVFMGSRLKSYDQLDDNDLRVPSGTTFSRLTAYNDEDLNGRLYTTFTQEDNAKYQGLYAPALRQRTSARNLYVARMQVGEDVRSPSHRKRVEAYSTLLKDKYHASSDQAKAYYDDYALTHYNKFARSLVSRTADSESYFSIVQKMGYNALLDDNDAGQLGQLPIILLNPSRTVSSRTFEELTSDMERNARRSITEIERISGNDSPFVPDLYRDREMTQSDLRDDVLRHISSMSRYQTLNHRKGVG